MKVSPIERWFDKLVYESYPQNCDFGNLSFDGDEILMARQQIYCINDDIVDRLNNDSIVDMCMNRM